jgi:co-chaperonin GroES (HSP10)
MKFIFGICLFFFFGLEGFAIDKKVPTTAIDSAKKTKAAIDSIKEYNPDDVKKVRVRNDDTLVFDDLEAPKVKDNDGEYIINAKETFATIAMTAPSNEKTKEEKMNETTIPFQPNFGKIYPNPAKSNVLITVDLKEEGDKLIVIRSANGEISKTYSTSDTQLQIVDLSPGIYFLQINLNGQYKTQRLYVQ